MWGRFVIDYLGLGKWTSRTIFWYGVALLAFNVAAQEGKPHDFVFSDFWMPDMNGPEFIEKLRADSRFKSLPVFAVTADTEYHNDARSALFSGILLKPLTYDKLVGVLAAMDSK